MSLIDAPTKQPARIAWWRRLTKDQAKELRDAVGVIESGERPDITWQMLAEKVEASFGIECNAKKIERYRHHLRSNEKGSR